MWAARESVAEIARRLGREPEDVRRRATAREQAGPSRTKAPAPGRRWTDAEDQAIRDFLAKDDAAAVAERLGRTEADVLERAKTRPALTHPGVHGESGAARMARKPIPRPFPRAVRKTTKACPACRCCGPWSPDGKTASASA